MEQLLIIVMSLHIHEYTPEQLQQQLAEWARQIESVNLFNGSKDGYNGIVPMKILTAINDKGTPIEK